jgi:hypothetical protein
MAKPPKQPAGITCKAVSAFKTGSDSLLTLAIELDIQDGVVVGIRQLNAPNLPAASIGSAQTCLWSQVRNQYRDEEGSK